MNRKDLLRLCFVIVRINILDDTADFMILSIIASDLDPNSVLLFLLEVESVPEMVSPTVIVLIEPCQQLGKVVQAIQLGDDLARGLPRLPLVLALAVPP